MTEAKLVSIEYISPHCGQCRSALSSPLSLGAPSADLCTAREVTCLSCGSTQWTRFARRVELTDEAQS